MISPIESVTKQCQACIYNQNLGKFVQPDTIISSKGNPQTRNRYSYTLNNPVNYIDPTGHIACGDKHQAGDDCDPLGHDMDARLRERYGVEINVDDWNEDEIDDAYEAILRAIADTGYALRKATGNESSGEAFKSAFGTDEELMTITLGNCGLCNGKGGYTYSRKDIRFASLSNNYSDSWQRARNNVVHELGHAFRARLRYVSGYTLDVYNVLQSYQNQRPDYPDRVDLNCPSGKLCTGDDWGFGSDQGVYIWQQSASGSPNEEFADQFLGWVYSTWASNRLGRARMAWMKSSNHMPSWANLAAGNP